MRAATLLILAAASLAGPAHADGGPGGALPTVTVAPQPHAQTAGTLYLNRCKGGCVITKGGLDDARSHTSTIPEGTATEYTLSEFAWGDAEWDAVVQCVKEVYSPFAVTVTDQQPTGGVAYNEAIIAGSPAEIGRGGIGGIAPVTSDCSPYSYIISFTFANTYGPSSRVFDLCAVAAQESGHSYGLDHTYAFLDGSSGCRDPMTYRGDCGGQKFFRNDTATCGEFSPRPCRCGANQNAHLKLLAVLGPGTPITRPPAVTVTQPADGATITAGTTVVATASAQRGIARLELWVNGYLWNTAKGVAWGPDGQPEAGYVLAIPPEVPDGILDLVVKAKDDIEVTTTAPTVTVTKGAPCTSADTCAPGQRCDAGRCLWDPAVGEIGEPCTYEQYCLSGLCTGTATETLCTQPCIPGVGDSCPAAFSCLEQAPGKGVCWPAETDDGGICSASVTGSAGPRGVIAAIAFALGLVLARRRRR